MKHNRYRWGLPGLLCLAGLTVSAFAQVADVERGRALYENHCQVCHTSKVHKRIHRIPVTRGEVREIVQMWQAQQKLGWGEQDINDVVEFLDRTQYRFK